MSWRRTAAPSAPSASTRRRARRRSGSTPRAPCCRSTRSSRSPTRCSCGPIRNPPGLAGNQRGGARPRLQLDAAGGVPPERRPDRPADRLDRAARVPVARHGQHPRRAGRGRSRRAARRAGATRPAVRDHAALCRLPGQPDTSGRDVPGGRHRPARLAGRAGLPADPDRQRPRREHAGARRQPCSGARRTPARGCATTTGGTARACRTSCARSTPKARMRRGWRTSRGPGCPASSSRASRSLPRRPTVNDPAEFRRLVGDGSFGGAYQHSDEDMLRVWQAGVEEVRDLLESGWD